MIIKKVIPMEFEELIIMRKMINNMCEDNPWRKHFKDALADSMKISIGYALLGESILSEPKPILGEQCDLTMVDEVEGINPFSSTGDDQTE
jgi:hypothetical protein